MHSETIEQTKQQIRGLVSEIAQLSKSDLSADDYYSALMQRIVSALAAVGGAIWLVGEGRRTELRYQINLSETLLDSSSDDASRHMKLLGNVLATGEPALVPPSSGDEGGGNPTRYLLVLAPLIVDGKPEGVVEIFQRPDAQPATQRGYLRFLIQMCELASEWLKSQKLKAFSDRHSLWASADHFARLVHESLDARETCYTIVNEGRRLIGCDRVTVAIKRGNRCKVEAISGQDTIEHRSNIVTSLNKLTTRVAAMGEPLWYDGNTEDLPPQITEALDEYVDESYSKTISILPIRRPKTAEERTNERADDHTYESNEGNPVIGAIVVEQLETDIPHEVLAPRIDLVFEHAARALANALDHSGIIFMPALKALSQLSFITKAQNLPKTLSVAAVAIVILLALFLIPSDFNLKAKGVLQPVERQDVFASMSGRVAEVFVKDRSNVSGPNPLVAYLGAVGADQEGSAVITEVAPYSPARKADLRKGDIVTEVDGQPISSFGQLTSALSSKQVGDRVEMKLFRDGRSVLSTATLTGQPGDALVRLENEDLEIELKDIRGRLESTIEQLSSSEKSQLNDGDLNRFERTQLAGRLRELKVTRDSLQKQLDLVLKKQEQLIIRAPISGQTIINWDVEKSLRSRLIERGQALMTVADLSKDWELEVFMKEGRMSHVSRARAGIKEDLDVKYILATDPGVELTGNVREVHGSTQMHEQEGSTVRIGVTINKEDIEELRPGASATAALNCGRAPLGYTWFHEVFEWVQANLLF